MQDRHVTYCEIEATLGISLTSIYKILHEHLAVKNICSRWIPHNLTETQKDASRLAQTNAQEMSKRMQTCIQGAFQNKRDFFKIAIYSGAIF